MATLGHETMCEQLAAAFLSSCLREEYLLSTTTPIHDECLAHSPECLVLVVNISAVI